MDFELPELAEIFEYLDELRASGETNMFGAGAWLCREFGMERKAAGKALTAWMTTFSDQSATDRAATALAA